MIDARHPVKNRSSHLSAAPGESSSERRGTGLVVLCVAALSAALLGVVSAQDAAPAVGGGKAAEAEGAAKRPTTRVLNCVNGGCHSKERDFKFVHGPSAVGACTMCHVYDDSAKHTFKLKRANEDLCNFCHIARNEGKVVHKPVAQGQCLSCHNPHGGTSRQLFRKDGLDKLCVSCHDSVTRGRKHVHGPVAAKGCTACHKSHSSKHGKLLVAEGRDLCLGCHKQMDLQLTRTRYVHKPVAGSCLSCHEAHASNQPKQLKKDPVGLCVSCHEHENIQKQVATAIHKHSPVMEGKACMNCHTAHASELSGLMRDRPSRACLSCHDKPIETVAGARVVGGVPELLDPDLVKHGPIRDGNCAGCHDIHGGDVSRLLVGQYPETFYEPFKVESYSLCTKCHTEQLVLAKHTTTMTRFRNGKTNLHYLHVNKAKRGRSCRAYHSTHASPNPMHVRKSIPYGRWEMPVSFTPTATGGACASGCHKELAYDRDKPVLIKPEDKPGKTGTTAETTKPPAKITPPAKTTRTNTPPRDVARKTGAATRPAANPTERKAKE